MSERRKAVTEQDAHTTSSTLRLDSSGNDVDDDVTPFHTDSSGNDVDDDVYSPFHTDSSEMMMTRYTHSSSYS